MSEGKRRIAGLLGVGLGLGIFLVVAEGWRRDQQAVETNQDPQKVLERYREAVLQGDRVVVELLLAEPLRQRAETLLQQGQRRSAQAISWVVVERVNGKDTVRFLVHEMGRDGWVYPVRYELQRQGPAWKIAQVAELTPQRAPIAPGTHIREVLGDASPSSTNGFATNRSPSEEEPAP